MAVIDASIINRRLLARIFSKIKISTQRFYKGTPCWEWIGLLTERGYGRIGWDYKSRIAHRFLYQIFVEPVPSRETHCDHLCRFPACVNPIHVEAVPPRINILRSNNPAARNSRKTHCKKGHPYEGSNLIVAPAKNGRNCRRCRTCEADRIRRKRRETQALPSDHPKRIALRIERTSASRRRRARLRDLGLPIT